MNDRIGRETRRVLSITYELSAKKVEMRGIFEKSRNSMTSSTLRREGRAGVFFEGVCDSAYGRKPLENMRIWAVLQSWLPKKCCSFLFRP